MVEAAIDLLWIKVKKVGGIESFARNLLDGFLMSDMTFKFTLLVSLDNVDSFRHYTEDSRFSLCVCNVNSNSVYRRVLWQNMYLGKKVKGLGLKICFEPNFCKPTFNVNGIKFVTVIHDLQHLHYPQYHSLLKNIYMRLVWKNVMQTSDIVVAITNQVALDIQSHFMVKQGQLCVVYNPVVVNKEGISDFDVLSKKYSITKRNYYYTVSSLLPHKNLKTLLNVFDEIKTSKCDLPCKLIVSGIGGKQKKELLEIIYRRNLQEDVILIPFLNDNERNTLYKYCKAFLFPSIFEGFGMPPVEAMMFGVPVITTMFPSIVETTELKAYYVNDAYNVQEWIDKMKCDMQYREYNFKNYEQVHIAKQYCDLLHQLVD